MARRRKESAAQRRARSVGEPRAAIMRMLRTISRRVRAFNAEISRVLLPAIASQGKASRGSVVSAPDDGDASIVVATRTDALSNPVLVAALDYLQLWLAAGATEGLASELDRVAVGVGRHNEREVGRVLGINYRDLVGVGDYLDSFRDKNVALIESLMGQQLVDITKILENGERQGLRVEVLRDQIRHKFGVSKSKASLLARDQVLKLNGDITRQRHQNLGIESYIWTTSQDEKVRGNDRNDRTNHVVLDGQEFRWDTPPDVGDGRRLHPGQDYQCRCTAAPVLRNLF